jgi:signal transduction histidine kinase
VIDPHHLSVNQLPPPVHIEQVTANRKTYWQNFSGDASSSHQRLPPLVRDLTIDYTALSFVAPEKVRFRYKLEGQDPDWKEVINDREAQYSNLPPGHYKFRVTACNNNGVWNEAGTFLDFSIAPAYYQTTWFRVSCVAAFLALLLGIFRLRVRSIEQRYRERKEAEEALRQAREDLTHANRMSSMGELTASLAHEVNQPIAAAVADANTCVRWLTRAEPDLDEAREAASRVVKDATRAAEIIKRVRLLFKKGGPERELVDVNEIIREMIVLLRSEAALYSIWVRTELAPNLPQVRGDRVQLQQVLMNLMMNSIDAMKGASGTRELTIKSHRGENDQLVISVSDTGVGLPPQQADQIFNAFFTTKPEGTGMGLRISRSIVESHGGRLWAAENSSRGASFHVSLPAKFEVRE